VWYLRAYSSSLCSIWASSRHFAICSLHAIMCRQWSNYCCSWLHCWRILLFIISSVEGLKLPFFLRPSFPLIVSLTKRRYYTALTSVYLSVCLSVCLSALLGTLNLANVQHSHAAVYFHAAQERRLKRPYCRSLPHAVARRQFLRAQCGRKLQIRRCNFNAVSVVSEV